MKNKDAVKIYRFWLAQYRVRNTKVVFTPVSIPIWNEFYMRIDHDGHLREVDVHGYNCILSDILVDDISSGKFKYFELPYIFTGRYGSSVHPITFPQFHKEENNPYLRIDINIGDPIEKVILELKTSFYWSQYIYGVCKKLKKSELKNIVSKWEEAARDYERYIYTEKEIQRVGKDHLSRALGLWIWDHVASGRYEQKEDIYGAYVNKVEDLEIEKSRRKNSRKTEMNPGLGEKATFNKLYRTTNKCIDLVQVLPFDPKR